MRNLPNIIRKIDNAAFVLSYADDSYIAISCDKINFQNASVTLNNIFDKHTKWLKQLA